MRETAPAHVEMMPVRFRVMPEQYFSVAGHFAAMPERPESTARELFSRPWEPFSRAARPFSPSGA
jgi:hypothetical protein